MNDAAEVVNNMAHTVSVDKSADIYNLTNNLNSFNESYTFDHDNILTISEGLKDYANVTIERQTYIKKWENRRNLYSILIFVFYLLIIAGSFLAFFKRWANILLALSIVLLFTVPVILVYNGLLASYFFVYSDFCGAVHGAMYENQFPVAGKGLGYLVNCFDEVFDYLILAC